MEVGTQVNECLPEKKSFVCNVLLVLCRSHYKPLYMGHEKQDTGFLPRNVIALTADKTHVCTSPYLGAGPLVLPVGTPINRLNTCVPLRGFRGAHRFTPVVT